MTRANRELIQAFVRAIAGRYSIARDSQRLFQLLAGAVEPVLHGLGRAAEGLGDFGHRLAFVFKKHQGCAEIEGQGGDRGLDGGDTFVSHRLARGLCAGR